MKEKRHSLSFYTLIYILTYVLSIIYGLGVIAVVVLLAMTPYLVFLDFYLIPLSVGALIVLYQLIPKYRKKGPIPELEMADANLRENIAALSSTLGCKTPDAINLAFVNNAMARRDKQQAVISIGLPFFCLMTEDELYAVVAHELSHHLKGDVLLVIRTFRVERLYGRILKALHNWFGILIGGPYRFAVKRIFRIIKEEAREQEYIADAEAASLFSPDAYRDMLIKLEYLDKAWPFFLERWLRVAYEFKVYPDLFTHFRHFLGAAKSQWQETRILKETAEEFDTHPSTHERLRNLEKMPREAMREKPRLKPFSPADPRYSEFYWQLQCKPGTPAAEIVITAGVVESLRSTYARIYEKYAAIFTGIRYVDCAKISHIFAEISWKLYKIDKNDNYLYERSRVSMVLIAILMHERAGFAWEAGGDYTPALELDGEAHTLGRIVDGLFRFEEAPWFKVLEMLQIPKEALLFAG